METATEQPVLTVYGREGCHLCQDMLDVLAELRGELGFSLETVDVDGDSSLKERYGLLVPVLAGGGEEICHYFLNRPALDAYLARIR